MTSDATVISKKVWDKLTPADRKIIQEAAIEAGTYQRSSDASATSRQEQKAKGMLQRCSASLGEEARVDHAGDREVRHLVRPGNVKLYRTKLEKVRATIR